MRFPTSALLSCLFLVSTIVTSSPTYGEQHSIETSAAEVFEWPLEAPASVSMRRRTQTNGERIQRGLGHLAPKRRYEPSTTFQILRPRISPPAQTAGIFALKGCAEPDTVGYVGEVGNPYTCYSPQAATNACPTRVGTSYDSFAVAYDPMSQEYSCLGGIPGSPTYETCDPDRTADYFAQ